MAEELPPTAPAAAPVAPVAEVEPTIPTDEGSFAEHEAAFGPVDPSLEGEAREKAEASKQKIRHRARSQQASPADVPRIQKLTKEKRELEERLAAYESNRPPAQPPQPQAPPQQPAQQPKPPAPSGQPQPPAAAQVEPTRQKPSEDEVGAKYPTYADFVEDLAEWKSEQRDAARQRESEEKGNREHWERGRQEWIKKHEVYQGRLAEFVKDHADYQALLEQHQTLNLPPPAYEAVLRHENGPAFMYHLLQHPDQLTEMLFLMDGKPASEDYVAHATRWLSSRVQAGTTGSAAATPPRLVVPRPPNPVRTGPLQTSEDVPGDDSSLAEHEHAFGTRRSARR